MTVALVAAFAAPVAAIPDWLKDPSYGDLVDLSKRRNLEQPISLEREDITVADFFQWLEDEHDIRLKAEDSALTKHLAIFVKERPAWEVLEAVAGSMHAEWRLYLTNLWLRLSHAPDDFEGLRASWFDVIGVRGLLNWEDEEAQPPVDRSLAQWAAALNPHQARDLFAPEGLPTSEISAEATRHLLLAAQSKIALLAMERLQYTISNYGLLQLDEPGSVCALWVEWLGDRYRFHDVLNTGSGGGGSSGRLPETLVQQIEPGRGAGEIVASANPSPEISSMPEGFGDQFAIRGLAVQRGYVPDRSDDQGNRSWRRPFGYELRHLAEGDWNWNAMARRYLNEESVTRLEAKGVPLEAGTALAKICRLLFESGTVSTVSAIPDGRVTRRRVVELPALRDTLVALEEDLQGKWYIHHRITYFLPSLHADSPLEFVDLWRKALDERLPLAWRREAAKRPRDPNAAPQPLSMIAHELMFPLLTEREVRHLEHDVLFWQDLQDWQRAKIMDDAWAQFFTLVTAPIPASLEGQLALARQANACVGRLTLKNPDSESVRLVFVGTPFDWDYPLPPGILAHLIKLKQQEDAEEKAAASAPPN